MPRKGLRDTKCVIYPISESMLIKTRQIACRSPTTKKKNVEKRHVSHGVGEKATLSTDTVRLMLCTSVVTPFIKKEGKKQAP